MQSHCHLVPAEENQLNLNQNMNILFPYNAVENIVLTVTPTLFKMQCVRTNYVERETFQE